jgi:hypothetical protein
MPNPDTHFMHDMVAKAGLAVSTNPRLKAGVIKRCAGVTAALAGV